MSRITSIGEILFDVYDNFQKLGGAPFNFIYHIIKLSGEGNFISRIGIDENGNEILNFLKKKNIPSDFIQNDKVHPTGKAVANLDENKIPHWVIEESCAYDFIETQSNTEELIRDTECLYFGTLAQRNPVSGTTIKSLLNRRLKYFCDLNIRQQFFTRQIIETSLTAADVLKLNEEELLLVSNLFLNQTYDLISSAIQIKNKFNVELLCVTCGQQGSYLFKEEDIDYYKPVVDKPIDTVGAGDAFAAVLCTGYLKGWDLKKLNKTANDFAGKIVMKKGALPENDDFYNSFISDFKND